MTRGAVPRRELALVGGAVALGLVLRLAFVLATRGHPLGGDEMEYFVEGRFIEDGKWFWTTTPYGIPHAGFQKAPGYPAWVGIWFALIGPRYDVLFAVQALVFAPATIVLTWLLGRRLFGPRAAIGAAFLVAVYPFVWQYEVRLYSEAITTPLTVLLLYLVLERRAPTPWRAAGVGALLGVIVLIRPSSVCLLAGVVVAWWVAAGVKRGTVLAAVTVLLAALVVAPWTYRNHRLDGGFVPVSVQDAAAYGTFNDDAADDPVFPYAWRPGPRRDRDIFARPRSDGEFREALTERAREYIREHPESVPAAFFWNGITRLWDVRRPARALDEVELEGGRSRLLTVSGLVMYYAILPLALLALWRFRRRHALVSPLLAIALAASVVYISVSGTRYRAPLEPVLAVLACGFVLRPPMKRRERTPAESEEPVANLEIGARTG